VSVLVTPIRPLLGRGAVEGATVGFDY
jgi:hypothetical protein